VISDWTHGLELRDYGIEYFIDWYRRRCALIVSAFVEELFQKRRDYLFLNPIIVNFPWARAGKESDALGTSSES
jgi:hypothetical protein